MNIEQIVKAWKSDEEALDNSVPENPVGEELTEEALLEVSGGLYCRSWSCDIQVTCDPYSTAC